jgi:diguanylate cyclase (GGDEF)-like protein/PAS domain S-box-containing protein
MMLSPALLDEAIERLEEAVLLLDDGLRIVRANAAFRNWSGYARDELAGQPLERLSAGWHAPSDYDAIRENLAGHGDWHGEIWQRRHNGEFHPDRVTFKRLAAPGVEAGYVLCCFTDATKRCEQEEKLQRMAMYDELTDLPNRRLLQIHLEQAMLRCQRHQRLVAVCMLDLDGFKPVNDRYGHEAGDQVLVVLGKRLPSALRKSDLVARIGGDEFVLLIEEINGLADLEPILNKVHAVISAPICLANGALIQVGTSVGVVLYPADAAATGDLLLRHADQALYASKNHKHDRARFWSLFGEEQVPRIDRRAEGLLAAERVEVH